MQIKLSNKIIILFEITLIFLSILTLYKISDNNQESYKATKNKLLMLQTADRLRQSSDDLTHFARTYVVTGDNKFKQQYYDTLNIRDGKKDRPLNYHSIYWDLDKNIRSINHKDTKKISLNSIFKSLPYDKQEIEKLKLSKLNSDDLVNLETEAFNAIDGIFKDINGNYNIKKQSNQALAIKLLHSTEYYNAKNKIMKPIDDFILMLDKRTTDNILEIHAQSKYIFLFLGFIILIFLIGNYLIFIFLNKQEQIKHDEKSNLLNKQKELNEQLSEKSKITQKLNRELEESEYELQTINENLKNTIKKEIEKNDKMHQQLFKSEKLASMGEMIGNIAHQWRQPLSIISTGATGIQMQKEYSMLTDEFLEETCDTINNNAQYLSKTIDDFTNFIKGDRTKTVFSLKNNINSFLHLVKSSIKNHHLNIILDLQEDIKIDGYENELTQCLINIFNNSKDILVEKDNEDKLIFISTFVDDNKAIIKIKDNAGGIPKDVLSKIFEPYFTTKHQSQGTGLGLHMTYNLIVDGMSGTIEANNLDYEYDGKEYTGAEFTITSSVD